MLDESASVRVQFGAEKLIDAPAVSDLPRVNVHTLTLLAGKNKLDFGRGSYVFLGIIDASTKLGKRDAQINIDNLHYRLDPVQIASVFPA